MSKLEAKPHKRVNKNTVKGMNLNQVAFQFFGGIDLFAIPGVSHSTVLTIMSELGSDGFTKFQSAKQFTSWLRLAPNNKISGGKMLSRRVPRGSNRVKIALRNAANAIDERLIPKGQCPNRTLKGKNRNGWASKDTDLSKFFARMAFKKGRQSAITATARKLATIIWSMISKQQQYNPNSQYLFLDQKRKQIAILRKKITKFGINPNDLGIFTRPEYQLAYEKRMSDNQ